MADLEELKKQVDEQKTTINTLSERIRSIETYFKIAFVVAVIFGVAGSFGASIIKATKKDLDEVTGLRDRLIIDIKNAGTQTLESFTISAREQMEEIRASGFSGDLIVNGNSWGEATRVSYPAGVHIDVDKEAACPDGTFVTGITVHYGGTCQGRCALDGGVVRSVNLRCASL